MSPESFALVFNALRSLDAWLQKPAEVGPGSGHPPPAPPSAALDPADFPMMPTGEGQCELAERRFPVKSSTGPLYHSYWWRAEAMMKLGRKREAVAALETFVRYCRDDVEYPEAAKALARLR